MPLLFRQVISSVLSMAKDYQNYRLFDFITDENFKSWIINPSPDSDYFWKSWLESHPEKADVIATAREFILSVKFKKQTPSTRKLKIYQQVVEASKQSTESSTQGFKISPAILKNCCSGPAYYGYCLDDKLLLGGSDYPG